MSDMSTPEMTRVTVRVPQATLDQINDWVDTLGVRRSHFLGIALVAGARSLIRASALDLSLLPDGDRVSGRVSDECAPNVASDRLEDDLAQLRAEVSRLREQVDVLLRFTERSQQPNSS